MSNIDYSELIVSKKGVITAQREVVGNIIGERGDSIIVEKDGMVDRIYVIPKSKISGYDGAQIILNTGLDDIRTFEQGKDSTLKDKVPDSVSETADKAKDSMDDVKDKVVDNTKDASEKIKDTMEDVKDKVKEKFS